MMTAEERHTQAEYRALEISQEKMAKAQVFIEDKINPICDMAMNQGKFEAEIVITPDIDYRVQIHKLLREDGYNATFNGCALYVSW